jgi:arylsulfatase B
MSPQTDHPNVVLVVSDDQGYGDLSCHGNPVVETPAMNRLHAESVRLDNFHVGTTCAPTRAALMTGRHKLKTGVWHTINGCSLLDRDEATMAELFSDAGYRTGIFGKWHLGDAPPYRPHERGFDESLVHGGGGVCQTPDYWGNDYFDDTYLRNGDQYESVDGYCTDVWFDEAIEFITATTERDDPFFCYLPTNAAHAPFQVPDEYRAQYGDRVDEPLARFFGMVSNIDDNLARLRRKLETLGVAENTIVVFFGDNGTVSVSAEHFNAGMRGHKGSHYEGGHRVHCFVHWPDRFEDRTVDRLTAHYDLLPTLANACGLSLPAVELDGRDLTPLLTDGDSDWPDRTLFVDTQRVERPVKWRNSAVLTDRWRLIDGEELYDIQVDPGQEHDVAEEHPGVVDRLRERYESWWEGLDGAFDQPRRIDIGGDETVTLTCHDWHDTDTVPWNQPMVLEAPAANGVWTLHVTSSGQYNIELRRWPREAGTAIDATPAALDRMEYVPGRQWSGTATAIDPQTAAIEIGDERIEQSVSDGAQEVTFTVDLALGPVDLRTQFIDADGTERGAYYAYISSIGNATP